MLLSNLIICFGLIYLFSGWEYLSSKKQKNDIADHE